MLSEKCTTLFNDDSKSSVVPLPLNSPGGKLLFQRGIEETGLIDIFGDFEQTHRNHICNLVLLTLEGNYTFCFNGHTNLLKKGDILFLPASLNNPWEFRSKFCSLIYFMFSNNCTWNMPKNMETIHTEMTNLISIKDAVDSILREEKIKAKSYQSTELLYSELILNLIYRLLAFDEDFSNWTKGVESAVNKISNDLNFPWTINDIAKLCNTSHSHLYRIFQDFFGLSPIQMLTNLRMKKTLELLSTDKKLTFIADDVGYSSSYALSKAFKRYYGIAPNEIRTKKKNNNSIPNTIN